MPIWGQIAGAVIGGVMGNKSAKTQAAATDRMNEANMAGFNQYKPFVDAGLAAGQGFYNDTINSGYYGGPTFAGPNQFQTGAANQMGGYGSNMMSMGQGMMNTAGGFGQNYADMYAASQGDRLNAAQNYAANNSGALTDSLMRDDRRNLQENTLTGINQAASGTGNVNSSRAGVADAIANRAYDDRYMDTKRSVNDSLVDRSLAQQQQQFSDGMRANAGLGNTFGTGMNTIGYGGNMSMAAGGALRGFDQGAMDDNRMRFEGNRDFGYDRTKDYMSGMLGRAPTNSNVNKANRTDVFGDTMGGAMSGVGYGNEFMRGYGNGGGWSGGFNRMLGG